MAKVSLRIYNREIESFIDQGQINEAIAHCHHILKTFSKHLATYRLLGKAYLELKRYNEAVDVFGRVLMSVPDDFVSHVGMSIINDEENKLDNAIWHMERAFEAQPSNAAIQGELQRLYGRRDGMEPPKVRMTRGALAHMYVQGELYPQAIAEIRTVLAEDPERADMQVLLARAYFRGGHKADASDMCAQLLKRYAFCFDANRIMVELLPATAGATENTQVYRSRVGELDPYATFSNGSVFQSDEVADAAVSLEKLEYKGEEVKAGQSWNTSLGLESGAPALAAASFSDEPDWLKEDGFSDPFAASQTPPPNLQAIPQLDSDIPDFLREAGWGESSTPEKPTSFFDEEPASGELTPAEIPDWLKGQAPAQPAAPQPESSQSTIDTPDWLLDNSQTSESTSASAGDIPDWLSGLDSQQPAASEPAQASNVPDWFTPPQTSATEPSQAGDVPDWLNGLDAAPQVSAAEPSQLGDAPDWLSSLDAASQTTEAEPIKEGDTPDWLSRLDTTPQTPASEPAEVDNVSDWLSGLDAQQAPAVESSEADNVSDWLSNLESSQPPEAKLAEIDDLPDWLSKTDDPIQEPSQPASSIENLGSTAQEQDDAVAWLESLAAKHGAKPEELVTDPSKRSETPPEWVSQAQDLNQQAPAASVENLGSTAQEQDDAVAWLESLAAKHGAKPEELITDPSKRSENPPEWVSQAQSIGEAQSAPALETEKSDQNPEIVENAMNIGEQFFAEFESSSAPATDATSAWLRTLDEEEKRAQAASKSNDVPDWISEPQSESEKFETQNLDHGEIPEWLTEKSQPQISDDQSAFTKHESETQKSDLPNWLSSLEEDTQEPALVNQDMPENDLSNWLNGLDDEPGLPFDSIPTPDSILFSSKPSEPVNFPKEQFVTAKLDLPDWLSDVESQNTESDNEWKAPIQEVPAAPVSVQAEEPVAANDLKEKLPDWLKEVDEEEATLEGDDTPPWLYREKWEVEAEEPQAPMPTSPSDWHPIEPKQLESMPVGKQELPVEPKPIVAPKDVPSPLPIASVQENMPEPQLSEALAKKKKPGLPARKQTEAPNVVVALSQAKGELDRGDIPAALAHYAKLIKKGKHLEETIRDLAESIYRYPVEVGIWQTLGDAYMRANRLKEALEAYNKAEELIR